ncbi:MAG TPA: hypothetical protein DCG49_04895 [Ruminococcus sp.]|nr:hypothetical protein [Ruminococcus sp.]
MEIFHDFRVTACKICAKAAFFPESLDELPVLWDNGERLKCTASLCIFRTENEGMRDFACF